MDIQETQELFENLLLANPDFDEILLEKDEEGSYEDSSIQDMYSMFEAGTEVGERSKQAQKVAVPEGFVLLSHEDIARLMNTIDFLGVKALGDEYISFSEIHKIVEEWQEQNKAMIEAQEQVG